SDVPNQFLRHVLALPSRSSTHAGWQLHHQYGIHSGAGSKSTAFGLRAVQSRYSQFHQSSIENGGSQGYSRERGGARTGVDAAHSVHYAQRKGEEFRKEQ